MAEEEDPKAAIVAKYDEMRANIDAMFDKLIAAQQSNIEQCEQRLAAIQASGGSADQVAALEEAIAFASAEIEKLQKDRQKAIAALLAQMQAELAALG